jgi:hypothetical protein
MDLLILVILIGIVIFVRKKFSSFVYFLAILDIFLRLLTFIRINVNLGQISNFVATYIPESIPSILNKYSNGIFNLILIWGYIICFIIFEYYTVRIFLKKK